MEFVNKIELRGIVGNSNVIPVGGTKVVRFSLVTEYAYKTKDGVAVIDTTWFSCSAWEKPGFPAFEKIVKGTCVSLTGRVRVTKYEVDGIERTSWEVLVNKLEIVEQP